MPSDRPVSMPMSPAHAAQSKNVSRRTIMRAIESLNLKAARDNRNHWKISPNDLDEWASTQCAPTKPAHSLHTPKDSPETLAKLAGETARADAAERARDQAEADRDAWREMAQKRHRWWPWK